MRLRHALITTLFSLLSIALDGQAQSDDRFFLTMSKALDVKRQSIQSVEAKKTNIEALYLLAKKASETPSLSNSVRFSVEASAVEALHDYLSTFPHNETKSEKFVGDTEISAAVFLLQDSGRLLGQIQAPRTALNVDPPIWTPGPAAAGMDPKGISDPAARAEYERRIATNEQALEIGRQRSRLQRAVGTLPTALKGVINRLASEGKAAPLIDAIATSQLPADVRTEILGEFGAPSK